MKITNDFLIQFSGLKLGKHEFEYQVNNQFFEAFEYTEFLSSDIKVTAVIDKKSTFMELHLLHKGNVEVPCDLTNEYFNLPIKGKLFLVIKFGEEYNNEDDEILILPHGEFQLDIQQYIYESIVLSIPSKRIHPGIKDGSLESEALKRLHEMSVNSHKEIKEEKTQNTDPRWDALKQLLTDKK